MLVDSVAEWDDRSIICSVTRIVIRRIVAFALHGRPCMLSIRAQGAAVHVDACPARSAGRPPRYLAAHEMNIYASAYDDVARPLNLSVPLFGEVAITI